MAAKVGPVPAPLLVAAVLAVGVWMYLRHRASTQPTSAGSNARPGVNSGYPQGSDSAGGGSTGGSVSGVAVADPAGPAYVTDPGRTGTIGDDSAFDFGPRPAVPEPPSPVARPQVPAPPGYAYEAPVRPAIPAQSSDPGFRIFPVLPYGGNTAPAFVASQPTRPGSTFTDGQPAPRAAVPEPPEPSERQTVPLPPPRPAARV